MHICGQQFLVIGCWDDAAFGLVQSECCVVQPADLPLFCLLKFPVCLLGSLKVTVVSSMLPISEHVYL